MVTKYTVVGTALDPVSASRMVAVGLMSLRHYAHKAMGTNLPKSSTGPAMVATWTLCGSTEDQCSVRISPDSSPASACLSPESLLLPNLLQAQEGR